jgi:hypothetical protein
MGLSAVKVLGELWNYLAMKVPQLALPYLLHIVSDFPNLLPVDV